MEKITVIVLGAGNRGMHAYSELSRRDDMSVKVVGVADHDPEKRAEMVSQHDIPPHRAFVDWREAMSQPKMSDAVIISTPDKEHAECAIAALNKGYHVLLEKPMAQTAEDCKMISAAQEASGKVLLVAHVLRYTKFFRKIKEIVKSKELGDPISVNISENVGYWHFAHSYVRGNWRREDLSGPIVLTKSCHDLDIICWLLGTDVQSVCSTGNLNFFTAHNAPEGSTETCFSGCRAKGDCIFDAEKIYCTKEKIEWPANVVSPVILTLDGVKKALPSSPYSRCVFRCDNDVCDVQNVTVAFKNNTFATLQINGHSADLTRKLYINFTKGSIEGDLNANKMIITKKTGNLKNGDELHELSFDKGVGEHAGGDYFLLKAFAAAVVKSSVDGNSTSAQNSLMSHLIAFAAEESRKHNKQVNF